MRIVLGTHNRKKLQELRELLSDLPIELVSLAEMPAAIEVAETGITFVENARLKAIEQARHLQAWVLAEDSGIEVHALDGRPGVYSARFAGLASNDAENNRKLLAELTDVPNGQRAARYVCQLCLADAQGEVRCEATGECRGEIGWEPRGIAGFGYDPLFVIPEYHRTFGELGGVVKRALSHRARAIRALHGQLASLMHRAPASP
jgi:XTP/dITP diphosphohydrolase